MTEKINFSWNWNKKLDNKYFTTIRKQEYNKSKIGKVFYVYLKYSQYCKARLIDIDKRQFKDINKFLLILDTGYEDYNIIFKRFKVDEEDNVNILLFKRMNR